MIIGTPGPILFSDIIAKALDYIKSLPDENILIVGHGAAGRALRRVVNGEPHTNEYIGELKIINNSEVLELF